MSLALVEEQRKIIGPILLRHNGREVKTIGDAFLVEFPNAVDAVRCAYDIQRAIREFNLSLLTGGSTFGSAHTSARLSSPKVISRVMSSMSHRGLSHSQRMGEFALRAKCAIS